MKTRRRILAIITCLVLLAMLSLTAFAASRTFFTKSRNGYRCTGSGSIDGMDCTAVFRATPIPGQSTLPDEACPSLVMVSAHKSSGELVGAMTQTGTTYTTAVYTATESFFGSVSYFEFMGNDLGQHHLFNS